jgi:hypothetical protein
VELRIVLAAAVVGMAGCGHDAPRKMAAVEPDPVRILRFYASPSNPFKGEKTMLCYSVENAQQVTLDPPVDRVWPAFSRCVEATAVKSTTYTLTASRGSATVSQTVTVTPGPPRMQLIEVSINKLEVAKGEQVMVCYKARNASEVNVRPGVWVTHQPDSGCVQDKPQADTTYLVTAMGPGGQRDSERVTAKVR